MSIFDRHARFLSEVWQGQAWQGGATPFQKKLQSYNTAGIRQVVQGLYLRKEGKPCIAR